MASVDPLESNPKLKETVSRLRKLVELSVTLNSTLNLQELLSVIVEEAAKMLNCEASSILLYKEKEKALFFAATTGGDTELLKEVAVPLGASLAGTVFITNTPLTINNIKDDSRHYKEVARLVNFNASSLLGVPLLLKDQTIGVLEALNKKTGDFTESDLVTLSVVASHAAVAIHNARLIQALKDAYEEVSKANHLKSTFLSLASHELRTPLGIIIGYATFLEEESEGETSSHAKSVLKAAFKMRNLLEDMNNLTAFESKEVLSLEKTNLVKVLEKAIKETEEFVRTKEQKIKTNFPERSADAEVNEKKLTAALVKLIHNASRFSPQKTTIFIGVEKKNKAVLCWVKDGGIGIPKEELTRIFDKFYQIESPNTRLYGGMGIGLSIAKGLIEMQGGRIWAESKGKNKGATIKILFPVE